MPLTFVQLAERILSEVRRPLTPEEIWSFAKERGYERELGSRGLTPWRTLSAELYVQARDNPKSPFVPIGARPKRFALRTFSGNELQIEAVDPQSNTRVSEDGRAARQGNSKTQILASDESQRIDSTLKVNRHRTQQPLESELHPYIAYFAYAFLRAHVRTIQHSKSPKSEFGEWVHPDIVGCHFPFKDWKPEVTEFATVSKVWPVRFFSFELKRSLTFSNLRESFFQAVSNSSWANEGYLCAASVSTDEDFRSELERLSTSFGIGVIEISLANPNETRVLFPARGRDIVDMETINKLAFNADFTDFLDFVKRDIMSKKVRTEGYDTIRSAKELMRSL